MGPMAHAALRWPLMTLAMQNPVLPDPKWERTLGNQVFQEVLIRDLSKVVSTLWRWQGIHFPAWP